uniref:Uncharacterized protein n=1 Tax=Romanomermis culicivorax TaxID=13658 RepID=A0A915IQF7_ROMCU
MSSSPRSVGLRASCGGQRAKRVVLFRTKMALYNRLNITLLLIHVYAQKAENSTICYCIHTQRASSNEDGPKKAEKLCKKM